MTMLKRIAVSAMTIVTLATTAISGITASATDGWVTVGNGYVTLINTTDTTRYGLVSLQVINRNTGASVERASKEGVLASNASLTLAISGYSPILYRFVGYGALYNGPSPYSGIYWSYSFSN